MIVVDTNVIAYLWMPGKFTQAAERVLKSDTDWAVPLLWRSEFRSILVGAVRHKTLLPERAAAIAAAAEDHVSGREYAVESSAVLGLAIQSGCSAYDCEFVTLANDLGVRLISNDRELIASFPSIVTPLAQFASE